MKGVKIVFGVLLILAGLSNEIVALSMFSNGVSKRGGLTAGEKLFLGIGFLGLGVYLLPSSKPKDNKTSQSKIN